MKCATIEDTNQPGHQPKSLQSMFNVELRIQNFMDLAKTFTFAFTSTLGSSIS